MFEFEWDEHNVAHLAKHQITPEEAEQVIHNRPKDIGTELRNGEERLLHVGETDTGRILNVVTTTFANGNIRVVTSWPAKERMRRYFVSQKRNGNVGRIEDEDIRE